MSEFRIKEEEYNRIKDGQAEAFLRLNKAEIEILELNKKMANIMVALKDNEISDLKENTKLSAQIKEMAIASGKKSGGASGKVWGTAVSIVMAGVIKMISSLF